jgi:two-component system alkaline phosphatase synthesis response regulator PhoP
MVGEKATGTDGRPHILVMNDVQEIVDLLQELLEEEGYRVTTSLYVLDLAKVKRLKPDLMVLDIMFEGEDKGWHFLTLSRLDRQLCRIPVILCTAAVRTVKEMEGHLAEQGVTVVPKPFDIDRLLREIGERL